MIINHSINPQFIAGKNISCGSYKNITLTLHSIQRGQDRLNVNSKELRKLASYAKRKGINITNFNEDTEAFRHNISDNDKRAILRFLYTTRLFNKTGLNSKKFYLFKGIIWVFCGRHASILKTVFELNDKYFYDDFNINENCNMLRKVLKSKYGRYTTDDIQDLFDCISDDEDDNDINIE